MIKPTIKQTAADSNTNAPVLHFYQYVKGTTYKNDGSQIDFVTDGKSLYVCAVESVTTTKDSLQDQDGMLKLVSQGEQGVPGVKGDNGLNGSTPVFDVKFDGKQLIISENGVRKAVSADLTGPSWKPVLDGSVIKWERTYDTMAPENIDLNDLTAPERPILLRTNSDNTKRSDETSGPAVLIQWKYEGQEEWTNLMTISELMNLALAGVSFWKDPIDGKYHFGHREVIKASYDSTTNGRKIISDVVLGDILFDAGEITLDYDVSIQYIYNEISDIKSRLTSLENGGVDLTGYATEEWVENKGYLTSHQPLDDYATKTWVEGKGYLTSHQQIKTLAGNTLVGPGNVSLKTINGESLVGTGDITVSGGGDAPDLTNYATKDWVNDKKYVRTVNGVAPNASGNVTISLANTVITDLFVNDHKIYYSRGNGGPYYLVTIPDGSGSGSGCDKCWSEEEIISLISQNTAGFLTEILADNLYLRKDNISVSQVLSSGEHIATITINGTPVNIYAPSSGGGVAPGGDSEIYYRTFMIYQRTESPTEAPRTDTITSASWDLDSNSLILDSYYWKNSPENISGNKKYLWMTSAAFKSTTRSRVGNWAQPVCLTGETGEGEDGNGIEFIFRLCTEEEYLTLKNVRPDAKYKDNRDDDLPEADSLAEHQWIDNPTGISKQYPYELAAVRTSTKGVWQTNPYYSMPFVWSRWGEDGVDGDGVEYVFIRAQESDVNVHSTTGEISLSDTIVRPNNSWAYDSPVAPWTDNPTGVNETYLYEFCSKRNTIIVNDEKVWSEWSEPSLWASYGKTGQTGPVGPTGGVGPVGPAGDQYEYVYARAYGIIPTYASVSLISSDDSTVITTGSDEYQTDGYLPKFSFDFSDSSTISERCTSSPSGVNSDRMYEFVSVRRKHNDTWGDFSRPALHSNFVEAGLTQEQLDSIKTTATEAVQDNLTAAISRISEAENQLTTAKNRLDNLDDFNTGITQSVNDINGRVTTIEAWTVYDENSIKSFAGQVVDAKKGQILQEASTYADGEISSVRNELNAATGTITNISNRMNELNGTVTSVGQRLSSAEGKLEQFATWKSETDNVISGVGTDINAINSTLSNHATRLDGQQGSLNNVQSDLNALEGTLTNTVSNSKYLFDENNNLLDYDGNVLGHADENGNIITSVTAWDGEKNVTNDYILRAYLDNNNKYCVAYQSINPPAGAVATVFYPIEIEPGKISLEPLEDTPTVTGVVLGALITESLSQIKQSAGQVDISAISGDQAAQILVKANDHTGSSAITLNADKIHLNGDVTAQSAAIDNVWINDAKITNGTITNATINDCTINSSIQSAHFSNTAPKKGFSINVQEDKFAFYSDTTGTQFDNVNGLVLGSGQTISWNNITDNSTVITEDTLNTNKINAKKLKVAELATAESGKRITINEGGAASNGNGNNAFYAYSATDGSVPGIIISGDELPELNTDGIIKTYTGSVEANFDENQSEVYQQVFGGLNDLVLTDAANLSISNIANQLSWRLYDNSTGDYVRRDDLNPDATPGAGRFRIPFVRLSLVKVESGALTSEKHFIADYYTGEVDEAEREVNGDLGCLSTGDVNITLQPGTYRPVLYVPDGYANTTSLAGKTSLRITGASFNVNGSYIANGIRLAPNGLRIVFGSTDNMFQFIKLPNGNISCVCKVDGNDKF